MRTSFFSNWGRWSSSVRRTSWLRSSRCRWSWSLLRRDPRHVEQVVDQPGELPNLPADHPLGATRLIAARSSVVEDVEAVRDGGERVTELMREHRQELVLVAVGLAQRLLGPLLRRDRPLELGDPKCRLHRCR